MKKSLGSRSGRFIFSILGVISIILGSLAVASPATAATCSAGLCQAKDPQIAGCSADARTIGQVRTQAPGTASGYSTDEIRYSPTCGAVWVRNSFCVSTPVTFEIKHAFGDYYIVNEGWGSSGKNCLWTNMAPMGANDLVRIQDQYAGPVYSGWFNTLPA
ncbi:DUF2690 domain-containing protein [Psychromicrobium silvestre]|uniref:DUF2690 domain-containing protein n=1 Tax=Psychromicrobium silvestre TaxID=1645614 RepID=UPI0015CA2B17